LGCLDLARQAAAEGEVPVGAVLVRDGQILAEAMNRSVQSHDPTAHAEIQCLRLAATAQRNHRLPGTTLYTSLEPCLMCAGALLHARVDRLVYAAVEPRGGAASSIPDLLKSMGHIHAIEVDNGLLAVDSAQLLQAFFRDRRD
jgi:tRNA(adenine34) deaminase